MNWKHLEYQGQLYGREPSRYPKDYARLRQYRKELLRRPTRAEQRMKRILFDFYGLSKKGKKKRKQRKEYWKHFKCQQIFMFDHPWLKNRVKGYIVDFFIPKERLIIEIDGDSHDNKQTQRYDATRTAALKDKGFKVLRIANYQTHDKHECFRLIRKAIKGIIESPAKQPIKEPVKLTIERTMTIEELKQVINCNNNKMLGI